MCGPGTVRLGDPQEGACSRRPEYPIFIKQGIEDCIEGGLKLEESALIARLLGLGIPPPTASMAQEWEVRVKPRGTVKEMWKDMARTVDRETQEEKIRQMVQYLYEHAYFLFIYSPVTLYAVNKEVDFVPQKFVYLRLKETSVTDNHWSVREEAQ